MICSNGVRECTGCMSCHQEGHDVNELITCKLCGHGTSIDDAAAGVCRECLFGTVLFHEEAYWYIQMLGFEREFYAGLVNGDYYPTADRIKEYEAAYWREYDMSSELQDLLRDFINDDLHNYAKWLISRGVRTCEYVKIGEIIAGYRGAVNARI